MRYRPHDSVRLIPGFGPKTVEHMARMGIHTIGDLLAWFPRRYLDATNPLPLNLVQFGVQVAVRVRVDTTTQKRTAKRSLRYLDAAVSDGTGVPLTLRFFNQPYLESKLIPGSEWTVVGTIERFHGVTLMSSPVLLDKPQVIPVYLQTKGVTSRMLHSAIERVLPETELGEEPIPERIRREENLLPYRDALRLIHLPQSITEAEQGRRELAYLEAFRFFMGIEDGKRATRGLAGIQVAPPVDWLKRVVASLPFELTAGQKRIIWDSLQEMAKGSLMTRLVNGDVGSGKTVVAAIIAAAVAQAGKKTLVLAPTDLLARQHAKTFADLLSVAGCRVALYTAAIKEDPHAADIVVGTHALLSDTFAVDGVGLVVIDEQHRFGVNQRARLRDAQAHPPHVLAMTATPIPRTLALVLFGDLDVSFLKEKPKGRLPVETVIVNEPRRADMYRSVAAEVAAGHQVFVLCPLISDDTPYDPDEPQDSREVKTVAREAERLRREHPELGRVAALHGKVAAKDKAAILDSIRKGEVDVLVSTSLIEVGIDLPNATVMIVENAERFGLAQLHQLRGRIGRGTAASTCYLCTAARGGPSVERLRALVDSDSGFTIAERDLELRGPGELTGTMQAGLPEFRLASLTDIEFLQRVRDTVRSYVDTHPEFLDQWRSNGMSAAQAGLE